MPERRLNPIDEQTRALIEQVKTGDSDEQYQAFLAIQALIREKVDWAYELWDDMVKDLTDSNNHKRARASQILCGLAKSDAEGRIFNDFPAIMQVTRDERFVTARHTIQSLWKIGLAGGEQKEMLLRALAGRYADCAAEKNCTLIRFDIVEGMRKLYDADRDEHVKRLALELIETEPDLKYRKKYAGVWKKA